MFNRGLLGPCVAIATMVFTVACSGEVTGPEARASLHVADEEPIVLRSGLDWIEGEIPFRLTNHTDRAFVIGTCNGLYAAGLQWWNGSEWEFAFGNVVPDCLGEPLVIASDEIFADTFQVLIRKDAVPRGFQANDGRYRLVMFAQREASGEHGRFVDVPEEQRVSNEFQVRIEGGD